MAVRIGTCGWQYADWRPAFYPHGVAQSKWLEFYSSHFDTVEVDSSFYRLPSAASVAKWRDMTPDGFLFSLKVSRYITHVRRLRTVRGALSTLQRRAAPLGSKLGPLLLQLPPTLSKDLSALEDTMDALTGHAVAFEPRHPSWHDDDVNDVLARHNAALCLADKNGRPTGPLWRTADWGYVRFHSGRADPRPCYGRRALQTWADRCAELWGPRHEVFAYFNNDAHACALRDARMFARSLERSGLRPSAVPGSRAVHLNR